MKAPCKNCADRVLGCHGKCKKYLEYEAANEITKEMRQADFHGKPTTAGLIKMGRRSVARQMKRRKG